jgi:HPt (histidine-containing phosphotransfer) domain-containing protein
MQVICMRLPIYWSAPSFLQRCLGLHIQSQVEELEELNQSLRNRDKMKDDAIAQLSDQLFSHIYKTARSWAKTAASIVPTFIKYY